MTQQVESLSDRRAVVLDLTVDHSDQALTEAAGRDADDAAFRADVLAGLSRSQKSIPSQYLYDTIGAKLFERITEQPEYYPTRTEIGLLREHATNIAQEVGPNATIVEPGSGAGEKVKILLHALDDPRAMVPVDIAREQLRRVARTLSARHPDLKIVPLWADFTQPIELPAAVAELHPRLVFFPGSTIGNFMPDTQRQLLRSLSELAGQDGALLIGFDRIKDDTTDEILQFVAPSMIVDVTDTYWGAHKYILTYYARDPAWPLLGDGRVDVPAGTPILATVTVENADPTFATSNTLRITRAGKLILTK